MEMSLPYMLPESRELKCQSRSLKILVDLTRLVVLGMILAKYVAYQLK